MEKIERDAGLDTSAKAEKTPVRSAADKNQIVLVFQGGGALGAYQAGVYEAMHEAGMEPDWVVGTSIGAINAALIAGNQPDMRLEALKTFWQGMIAPSPFGAITDWFGATRALANWATFTGGVAGFFDPRPLAFFGLETALSPDDAGFYRTEMLEKTLGGLIDPASFPHKDVRLTVGAAKVTTSEMYYFDSRNQPINLRHVMASGALPPAFPAVRIDDELYWDGGIVSNTPVEVVFDDNPRRNSLIFAVHVWNPKGAEPRTLSQILHRHKDIQYSSRAASNILRQRQIHNLRHVIEELGKSLPVEALASNHIQEMLAYGCRTQMHVVQLMTPSSPGDTELKDIDFSSTTISSRWVAGYQDMRRALDAAPWNDEYDPLAGFHLHQPR